MTEPIKCIEIGTPDFENLPKVDKYIFILRMSKMVKAFYEDPNNRAAYEEWKAARSNHENKSM